jgi:citronellol/citronellal dehydrogenase
LKKSLHAHILNLSPPINLNKIWFKNHVAYTLAKYSMSIYALGWAEEFKSIPISVNCLWPKSIISTSAIKNNFGKENIYQFSRKPSIVADSAFYILSTKPGSLTGKFLYVK